MLPWLVLPLCTATACAATLHGRVKDSQCAVLARATVHIRGLQAAHTQAEQRLTTDNAGNYTAELPAGAYEVCIRRGTASAAACSTIDMPTAGDKWMTTQLRDAAPDLSHLGNRAE